MPISTRRRALRRILSGFAAPALLATTAGCGTILHPERKGQPAGRIDWKIAALDGLGLILFFVPGVIAFAVDFNNGTIYLPPGSTAATKRRGKRENGLMAVSTGTNHPTDSQIEQVLIEEAGVTVDLRESKIRKSPLISIHDFWAAWARCMKQELRAHNQSEVEH